MILSLVFYDALRSLILPLREIDKVLPKSGEIIDLGCGNGVIAKFIAKKSSRKVTGIDLNKNRIPQFSSPNLKFIQADITKYKFDRADAVVISDVLHHLSYANQDEVITNIYAGLRKKGVAVIKEIDASEFIRSRLSRFWDFILYPQDKILYISYRQLKTKLNKLGFKVKILRPCRFFPGSTTLYICKK